MGSDDGLIEGPIDCREVGSFDGESEGEKEEDGLDETLIDGSEENRLVGREEGN